MEQKPVLCTCSKRFKTSKAMIQHQHASPRHVRAPQTAEQMLHEQLQSLSLQDQEADHGFLPTSEIPVPSPAPEQITAGKQNVLLVERTKKKKKEKKKENKVTAESWSMYPELHDSVSRLLEEEGLSLTFFAKDDDNGSIDSYNTNIMGHFNCSNQNCRKTRWTSMVIAITIRLYPKQQYNARVYHQRCNSCKSLSKPFPDDSYADRIAYRLKKWSGIVMEAPFYDEKGGNGPHESDLCEGCKHGVCKKNGRRWQGENL